MLRLPACNTQAASLPYHIRGIVALVHGFVQRYGIDADYVDFMKRKPHTSRTRRKFGASHGGRGRKRHRFWRRTEPEKKDTLADLAVETPSQKRPRRILGHELQSRAE